MKAERKEDNFPNRVRFNWGFHDAVQTVREKWNTVHRNFGFGSALAMYKPEDVLEEHYDKAYAFGWLFGYYEVTQTMSECQTSDAAWQSAMSEGHVED